MKEIDQALRAKQWPTDRSLASDLDVNARTIRRDLEYMRDQLRAPIEFDRGHRGYYFTEPTFRLPTIHLTQGELIALLLAERLPQFHGTPFGPDLRRTIEKLGDLLPDHVSIRVG